MPGQGDRETLERTVESLLKIFNVAYSNFVSLAGLPVVTQQGRVAVEPIVAKHAVVLQGFRIEWLDLNLYKILQNLSAREPMDAMATAIPALTELIGALIERYRFFLGRGVTLLFDRESRTQIVQSCGFLESVGAWAKLPEEVRSLTAVDAALPTESFGQKKYETITLRSGRGEITFRPVGQVLGVLAPQDYPAISDVQAAVRTALAQPIGTPRLATLAAGVASVVIIVDDQTRPTPTREMLPLVLEELAQAQVPDSAITLLVATGMHRAPTADELARIISAEIAARCRVVIHDCKDETALVPIGKTRSGVTLTVNRAVAEASLVVALGMIAPHPYAGFTGGPKSILPGVAGLEAIVANHTLNVFPSTGAGKIGGNPVQEDIVHAGRLGRLAFVVNAVLSGTNQVVGVLAGDPFKAPEEGFQLARRIYQCGYPAKSDVVIVSCGGHPRDGTLYLAVRAVKTASLVVRRGGYIVLVVGCEEETGPKQFAQVMRDMPRVFEKTLKEEPEHVIAAHVLKTTNTIVVSHAPAEMFQMLGLRSTATVEAALEEIAQELDRAPTILVITNGWSVIPDRRSAV